VPNLPPGVPWGGALGGGAVLAEIEVDAL